jgi:ATP-binding cassette subfamily B protein
LLLNLLWRYLRPYRWWLLGVLIFQFASALAMLYLPTLNANIIDRGVALGDTAYIWRTGGFMLLVSLGQIVAATIATWYAAKAAMSAGRDLRNDIYHRVSGYSEREISQFGAGSLITRNTNDVQQVQMLAMSGTTMLVSAPLMAIGGIIMAVRQNVDLSWIIAVSVPLLLVFAILVLTRMLPLFRSYQERLDAMNRIMREQLSGVRVVRAFVREEIEAIRYRAANTDMMVVGRKVGSLFVLLFPVAMLILNVTMIAVIWFGAHGVDAGQVEIGTLMAFMQYVGQILMGVMMATFMIIMVPRAAVSAERITAVMKVDGSLSEAANTVSDMPTPGTIEFDNVTFSFPGADSPVLENISFVAQPGQTVAVVGSTGAGKTTLISLAARLLEVSSGSVRIGGVDVRDLSLDRLWRSEGLVPQKPFLFSGTVKSNVAFGNVNATDEEAWRALSIAQGSDFVSEMPHGLGSYIAQGGTNVSGGQRQRIAIARAIAHNPDILLLDDSFSALDVATDAKLRAALWQELPNVTKLVVAQRISSIMDADLILVLDQGHLVGSGAHEQLLATNETYREIAQSQLGETGQIPADVIELHNGGPKLEKVTV